MLVIHMCPTMENTHSTTHVVFLFCVWLVLIFILQVPTFQETGTAQPLFLRLLSAALGLDFARLQGLLFLGKRKNASACSWLHMHLVLILVSIGSETDSEKKP